MNLQPFRWVDIGTTKSASIVQRILDTIEIYFQDHDRAPSSSRTLVSLNQTLTSRLASGSRPSCARCCRRSNACCNASQDPQGHASTYSSMTSTSFQGCRRSNSLICYTPASGIRDVWLKVATIRNLSRWFDPSTQTGLQIGHDADALDLDVTLQDPARAKLLPLRMFYASTRTPQACRVSGASSQLPLLIDCSSPRLSAPSRGTILYSPRTLSQKPESVRTPGLLVSRRSIRAQETQRS